jgi:hypothetical protein
MPISAGSRHPLIESARIAGLVIAAIAEGIEAWRGEACGCGRGVGAEDDDGCGCKGPEGRLRGRTLRTQQPRSPTGHDPRKSATPARTEGQ